MVEAGLIFIVIVFILEIIVVRIGLLFEVSALFHIKIFVNVQKLFERLTVSDYINFC